MRAISRPPRAALRPFVRTVWAARSEASGSIERVLPTGCMHVVVRLSPEPLVLFDDERGNGARAIGHSVVGGARSSFYVRSVASPSHSVGAMLVPGAAPLLFSMPATELAERHTSLDDVFGREASLLRDRLAEARAPEAQLDVFEAWLSTKFPRVRGVHPLIADAIARFSGGARVADVVAESGYSHRAFIALFRDAVGLAPKAHCRVVRAQRATTLLRSPLSLAQVAAETGYADQAHLARELVEIAGISPNRYRALDGDRNHVPIR